MTLVQPRSSRNFLVSQKCRPAVWCWFHQITARKDAVPLTAFCTPTGLYEWLVMPQGSSASPGWFVKVMNEVVKGLEQVAPTSTM